MRCAPAALSVALAIAAPGAAGAQTPVAGIAIGSQVAALTATLGVPEAVASLDSGQRFVFAGGTTAYTDDDGIVLAVETRAGNPAVAVDGTVRRLPIGRYTAAEADVDLAAAAEFATPELRSYRIAPRRDLVLSFDPRSNRLAAVTFGEPGQLARLALLAGDAAAHAVVYHAPQRRTPLPAGLDGGPLVTVYRVAVDRGGAVDGTGVFIASANPARDSVLAALLLRDRYLPATLDGRPIAATVFLELHHA